MCVCVRVCGGGGGGGGGGVGGGGRLGGWTSLVTSSTFYTTFVFSCSMYYHRNYHIKEHDSLTVAAKQSSEL